MLTEGGKTVSVEGETSDSKARHLPEVWAFVTYRRCG